MKEEYKHLLTDKQKVWLESQLHRLEGGWKVLVTNVTNRGKYSTLSLIHI